MAENGPYCPLFSGGVEYLVSEIKVRGCYFDTIFTLQNVPIVDLGFGFKAQTFIWVCRLSHQNISKWLMMYGITNKGALQETESVSLSLSLSYTRTTFQKGDSLTNKWALQETESVSLSLSLPYIRTTFQKGDSLTNKWALQ